MRLLLVEDDVRIASKVKAVLEDAGYAVGPRRPRYAPDAGHGPGCPGRPFASRISLSQLLCTAGGSFRQAS